MQERLFDHLPALLAAAATEWIAKNWKTPDKDDPKLVRKRIARWTLRDFELLAEECGLPFPDDMDMERIYGMLR